MGLREGLVEVEVNGIKAHQSGRGDAEDGVEVRTVIIHLAAGHVDDFTGCFDVSFKQTQGVGVGDHHRRRGFIRHRCKRIQIHSAVLETGDFNNLETGHGGAGWVRAVSRIGNDDLGSLVFSTQTEVLLNATNGRKFALGTCHGLEGDLVHACTDLEHVLHLIENREQALQVMLGLVWVNVRNTRELGNDFVDPRVVLHRA